MPRPLSYTPEWLSRGSAGFDFLSASPAKTAQTTNNASPNRRLAHRGTELFYATGSELRWGDLNLIESSFYDEDATTTSWRILKTPVAHAIEQLSVSPDGSLLAVTTRHTCHVCILPTPSHLRSGAAAPLRIRSFQVGPTAHVLEQAPLATCLWHPLSSTGLQCLVTITTDASVRLWELDLNNRHSFDQAGVAVDLKKLANATSIQSDLSASKFGANRGFSPDDVEMEVAAACFGGQGLSNEHGWASMTLWLAMVEGDVYALCPLLPSRFRLSAGTLPALSTSTTAEAQLLVADQDASEADRQRAQAQLTWLTELDDQEPLQVIAANGLDVVETYTRPDKSGTIAKLQGPFHVTPDTALSDVTDIFAIAPAVDDGFLYDLEDEEDAYNSELLSVGILCLATTTGDIHVCLNLEPIQPQWLPAKRNRAFTMDDDIEIMDLLLFQTVSLPHTTESGSTTPSFTLAQSHPHEVLVTTAKGVFNLDFGTWSSALQQELAAESSSGVEFRLRMLLQSASTEVEPIITAASSDDIAGPTTAVVLHDSNLGHFVITTTRSGPRAATLSSAIEPDHAYEPELLALPAPQPRESYQPRAEFHTASELSKTFSASNMNPVTRALLAQPVRSKPETLQLLTHAHRILSHETNRLGLAAADLFRRCERMRVELADQVSRVDDISQKVTSLTTNESMPQDEIEGEDNSKEAHIEQRIMKIQSDTTHMNERLEALRRNMLRIGGEDLSTKERAFANEIWHLQDMLQDGEVQAPVDSSSLVKLPDSRGLESSFGGSDVSKGPLVLRFEHAEGICKDLTEQAQAHAEKQETGGSVTKRAQSENDYKKQRSGKVMQLLDRESALLEAVTERLGRLGGLS